MIRKKDVIKMLDEWLERLDESDVSEAIECVLLMVKNRIENMPDAVASNARLIDAEKLKETIEKGKIIIDSDVLECDSIHKTLVYLLEKVETFVMQAIDAQLTADAVYRWNTRKPIERIVERLEESCFWTASSFDEDGYCNDDSQEAVCLDKAIEIVKEEGGFYD